MCAAKSPKMPSIRNSANRRHRRPVDEHALCLPPPRLASTPHRHSALSAHARDVLHVASPGNGHGVTTRNATRHTHGFAAQEPGPLMSHQRCSNASRAVS